MTRKKKRSARDGGSGRRIRYRSRAEYPAMTEPIRNGLVTTYRTDGSKLTEATYEQGVLHGPYRDFWSHGGVSLEGQYVNGIQEGEWRLYDRVTGRLREIVLFHSGREVAE
jgi:antitoxin component YwqK of YwqJK toxin-antitoxin module